MKRKEQQSTLRRRKKAKIGSGEKNDEDRLSSLPDELCSYILSKLPTVDAMKTSFLSKRWEYMWITVTNLEFDFVRHFVQELELCIPKTTLDKLPDLLFTSKSLKVLKLDDNVIWELISSCPKLENLCINNCSMYHMKILNICSSELQNLSLIGCDIFPSCEVNISASKLKSFRYNCPVVRKFSLEHLCTLTKADIDIQGSLYFVKSNKEHAKRAIKIIGRLNNVRTLTLSSKCIEFLATALDLLESFSCNLNNVRHLDVTFWCHKSYIKVLSSLLMCCSAIETLSVGIDMTPAGSIDVHFKNVVTTVPMCPLFNLKTLILRNFVGVNKLDLVKSLVKNAKVLEKIVTISAEGVAKERTIEWIKRRAQ
ncbi:F-box/FBD/LRR-repeat protein At5g22660-like [Dioscorea cayenensis subsp. rotundata]|uniref:F-box/FBD/LRR-repeat protein At5g22660-like n=1 Tax=Dioscorea cayennensis subsp. rotundata TaxID=55577 RepID=A0AB40BV34_DIOCR|nr:F-box/FBD/LRR-repeat protein At5g22660-like [Dioscorea cayenensis subsp. rotundata]